MIPNEFSFLKNRRQLTLEIPIPPKRLGIFKNVCGLKFPTARIIVPKRVYAPTLEKKMARLTDLTNLIWAGSAIFFLRLFFFGFGKSFSIRGKFLAALALAVTIPLIGFGLASQVYVQYSRRLEQQRIFDRLNQILETHEVGVKSFEIWKKLGVSENKIKNVALDSDEQKIYFTIEAENEKGIFELSY